MTTLAIVDVYYRGEGATAACVVAGDWCAAVADEERCVDIATVAAYEPGRFYLRELPCLLAVLAAVRTRPDIIVVDGYVDLDGAGAPGLGAHLHAQLGGRVAVVGVAKRRWHDDDVSVAVLRGGSRRPLHVTARGLPLDEAARAVAAMHGPHRIPTLLARADALSRFAPGATS